MTHKVLTIGDAMITMNPMTKGPLRSVTHFERKIGGAELNFAVACARLGLSCRWISRLGNDEFGRVIYNFARGEGLDMSAVTFVDGFPTSINFKSINEDGSGETFYYRFQSPILTLTVEDIKEDWFDDIQLVHLTGVFLAIAPNNREIVRKIIHCAKKRNIPISFDPNLRLKLWPIEEAAGLCKEIISEADLVLAGHDEMQLIFSTASQRDWAQIAEQYQLTELVIKQGERGAMLYREGQWIEKEAFKVKVVDTVGAGDGFDAGYIYAYLNRYDPEKRLIFANGVGALVTTVSGDNEGLPYLEEVEAFIYNKRTIER